MSARPGVSFGNLAIPANTPPPPPPSSADMPQWKKIVIGVCVGVGGALLLLCLALCVCCCHRRKRDKKAHDQGIYGSPAKKSDRGDAARVTDGMHGGNADDDAQHGRKGDKGGVTVGDGAR